SLPRMANVRIMVYDMLGRAVSSRTLYGLSAGRQGYLYDASSLASGAYFYRVQMLDMASGEVIGTHAGKMMLVK
ncbi:MAG TPA: T9SS type A sorting domain-containing protein, partial [Bacteroidota bacterium]